MEFPIVAMADQDVSVSLMAYNPRSADVVVYLRRDSGEEYPWLIGTDGWVEVTATLEADAMTSTVQLLVGLSDGSLGIKLDDVSLEIE